ncbi:HMP-PP phosphatase [Paraliobacillus sp. PM-2]|uniref:HAD family hydrolase n=1 Tax=Paraliobacillus sp. PM-2 TaxID=1462524 RepID=UPI00061CC2D0|nr:HAD family hydrolase [Paraliobacillus sp. PM-2]CQR47214.1 HMP-PP phosphatase [Paraliobacillus sp. PM-2]
MIKLFATDLDGTLLQNYSTILEEDKQAIQLLHDHNVELAIATGRADNEIQEIYRQLALNGHRVSQNGSFVHNSNNHLLLEQTFPNHISQALFHAIEENGINYLISTAEQTLLKEKTPFFKKYEDVFFFPLVEHREFDTEIGNSIIPSKFMIVGETHEITTVQKQLDQQFNGEVESYLSDPGCVDIVPKGINKGNALTQLLETIEIKPEEIAVIGDSFNDISMLQMTPHSYAISTADPEVKQHAAHIVDHVHQAVSDLQAKELL